MSTLRLAGIFALHVVVGIVLFIVIALGVLLLDRVSQFLVAQGVPSYITSVIGGLEFLLFAIDVLCLSVFMIRESVVFIRGLLGI